MYPLNPLPIFSVFIVHVFMHIPPLCPYALNPFSPKSPPFPQLLSPSPFFLHSTNLFLFPPLHLSSTPPLLLSIVSSTFLMLFYCFLCQTSSLFNVVSIPLLSFSFILSFLCCLLISSLHSLIFSNSAVTRDCFVSGVQYWVEMFKNPMNHVWVEAHTVKFSVELDPSPFSSHWQKWACQPLAQQAV